jgi:hypothetical protein
LVLLEALLEPLLCALERLVLLLLAQVLVVGL